MTSNLYRVLASVGVVLSALPSVAAAQQATVVSGRITNEANAPVVGASVSIPSLAVGAYSANDGRYTFSIPANRVSGQTVSLVARRIGFTPVTVSVTLTGTSITRDIQLSTTTTQIEGVLVTALGLEREKRSLGVAAQSVSGADLNTTKTPNIVNALSGKVAGVKVTGATTFGGSSRIVIRGENSISGNNQPLFVVDGVPIDNSNVTDFRGYQARGYGGFDYGNATQDLNSDDIESVSVLKGPAAAALYGSRAANGAVVITTKSGKGSRGGFTADASTNVTFETISKLPDYQNAYGQGAGGEFQYLDGNYGGVNDGEDASWGPPLDGRTTGCIYLPNTTTYDTSAPCTQWFSNGQATPWVAHPDNVRSFFQTGRTVTNNFATTGSSDRANFRLSFGTQQAQGIVPTSSLSRITTGVTGAASLSEKLSTNATVQYVQNRGNNRPGTGYDEFNPMMGFVWFGRQIDVQQLKSMVYDSTLIANNINGHQANWNYNYHNNPYWNLYQNNNHDERNRLLGTAQIQYKAFDWLTAQLRSGTDFYANNRTFTVAPGWIGGFFDPYTNGDYTQGGFSNTDINVHETNTDFLLTSVTNPLSRLGLTLNFGGNRRVRSLTQKWIGTDQLVLPGTYNISNSAIKYVPYQYDENRAINSLYGTTQFAYNDYFFVDVTGRNDWSSTLPKENNSYFYPSVSSSLVFTDMMPALKNSILSYGKLRGAWTRVGSDADPYLLAVTYALANPFGSVPRAAVPNTVTNPLLKPEQTQAWEVGTELSFLDGRAGADFTYYTKKTTNQILTATVSPTSGFTAAAVNAGELSNRGVELQLTATPLKMANSFTWDVTANYAHNTNRLESLYGNSTAYQIGSKFFQTSIEARVGEPYGSIVGHVAQRDANGNLLLDSRGRPLASTGTQIIGNIQPKWTGGLINQVRYKNFDLSAQVDAHIGGQLWSATNRFGTYAGILSSTLVGRDTGIVMTGVDATTGAPVTRRATAENYFKRIDGIEEYFVYDATYVKLRELRLGWNVPPTLTRGLSGYRMNVALVGRNLLTHSNAPNIDPETAFTATNLQGIEFGQLPPTRSWGFQINVTP